MQMSTETKAGRYGIGRDLGLDWPWIELESLGIESLGIEWTFESHRDGYGVTV